MNNDADVHSTPTKSSRTSKRLRRLPFLSRKRSPPASTFSPSLILPEDGHEPHPKRPEDNLDREKRKGDQPVFGAPAGGSGSRNGSASPPSVFDRPDQRHEQDTEPTSQGSDEAGSYDLKPPPPAVNHDNIEALAGRLYSADHLDIILRDQNAGPRFMRFLDEFKPQHATTLKHYLETKKAITAIEYANAIANQVPISEGESPHIAATLDEGFNAKSKQIVEDLVDEALPAYVTYRLVSQVTDTMVKEITGNSTPLMKEMIPYLAEVYCISDPSLPDNPLVYASEEFSNCTQYGRDYIIGRNCRFLQGPQTTNSSVGRLIDAIAAGEEICETILNYRRDGSPFMNLLLIAPLYDNKGEVRYYLGCQIDVSSLVEGGKALDSFAQLLTQDRSTQNRSGRGFGTKPERDPMELLADLGQMLNETESDFVMNRIRSTSQSPSRSSTPPSRRPSNRRYLSMDDSREGRPGSSKRPLWPDAELGRSGRLPGVYRNYLLVRPYPSLRVTFTSPTLRIPGLLQTKLLDRIGGPQHLRDGILEAFQNGTGVTAKVSWLTNPSNKGDTQYLQNSDGKPRWIHCTPMLGSDGRVGVWMVVLVENEEITGLLNRQNGNMPTQVRGGLDSPIQLGAVDRDNDSNKMYSEYLKDGKDGRPTTNGTQQTSSTARERKEVDDNFRDF